jgi:hypothetical protein
LNCDPLQITVHARLLDHSVLGRSACQLETEMLLKLGQLPASRKSGRVKKSLLFLKKVPA